MAIRYALVLPPTDKMYRDARRIGRGEPDYPAALSVLTDESAPDPVWIRGRIPDGRRVSIVGARAATADGLVAARTVAAALAGAEITVVSGGAIGIDGAAHRGALDAGGRTVVVLGTGIDVPYPQRHAPLFDEAVAKSGAVLTPFPPGSKAAQWSFPRRNRLVAALAEAVVVIEASERSGSLHTAAAARKLGRRLVVLRGTAGCDLLAARGQAEAATDIDDLVQRLIGGAPASGEESLASPFQRPLPPPLPTAAPERPVPVVALPADPRARRLYEALDDTPRDLGELAHRAGVPAAEVMALAIDLELGGLAARAAGGRYLRLG